VTLWCKVPRPPLRLLRLANPVARAVLDSRAHRTLSGRLVVVEYRGYRSGRTFRIPLRFAPATKDTIVVVAVRPQRKNWWRSFARPAPAVLRLGGSQVRAEGALVEGGDRERALTAYLHRYPRSERLTLDAAVVVFERGDG
jgi:hypothetical protein